MATWEQIIEAGRGSYRLRLMIEGWPHEFVSDQRITHADNADGRTVLGGLSYKGIVIHDRVVMHEASIQASGIQFKIVPTHGERRAFGSTDPVTESFSTFPEPLDWLDASLTDDGTTMAVASGDTLDDGIYYIGSETIRVNTWDTIERAVWDSLPQAHNVNHFDQTRMIPVYDSPPTMEGRRVFLYAYGEHDDNDGEGTCIWRGIVSRPPSLDADCVTWVIHAQSITHVLKQDISGRIKDAKPIGINHHADCAVYLYMKYDTDAQELKQAFFARDETEMFTAINTGLESLRTATGAAAGVIASVTIQKTEAGHEIVATVTGDAPDFIVIVSSQLFGSTTITESSPSGEQWFNGAEPRVGYNFGNVEARLTTGTWHLPIDRRAGILFDSWDGLTAAPIGVYDDPNRGGWHATAPTADTANNRIHVSEDLSEAVGDYVNLVSPDGEFLTTDTSGIQTSTWHQNLLITGAGQRTDGTFWIEVSVPANMVGMLTSTSEVRVLRAYGVGSVAQFVAGLKAKAITNGNDGDTPFITDEDLTEWDTSAPLLATQALRTFTFTQRHDLLDVIQAELKYATHFMRIESDGRIGIKALPAFTEASPVADTHVIDVSSIITPDGTYGAWERWEPQRDGRITVVSVQVIYDETEDDWTDHPAIFQDAVAIAVAKMRGKTEMKIRPYSRYLSAGLLGAIDFIDEQEIASRYLSLFARDYIIVTLRVPFKHFPVLTGDVCSITSPRIPSGTGARGMTERRAVCIERRWPMDPAQSDTGELTFLVPARPITGYAPSAIVTDQTNTSGNVWVIECDSGDELNQLLSTDGDGDVLQHFSLGDYVRVCRRDDPTPTFVSGTVTTAWDPALDTIGVTFGATWTPGSDDWVLEFDSAATGHTALQDRFTYVADSALKLADGSPARVFS